MGKHETGYARIDRDVYPTPAWVTRALLQYLDIEGLRIWEPAAGAGHIVRMLEPEAVVIATDIAPRNGAAHHDFTERKRVPQQMHGIITNPPFGPRGTLAVEFIRTGLWHLDRLGHGFLALLLPVDFDSASTRAELFGDCPWYRAKLVLTRRIVWFERTDGVTEAPKENHAWFIWERSALRQRQPIVLYHHELDARESNKHPAHRETPAVVGPAAGALTKPPVIVHHKTAASFFAAMDRGWKR